MPPKPLDDGVLDLVISASNRFVEAFEEKKEIEGKTNRKSVDSLICDYKFFLGTVFEHSSKEVTVENQKTAVENCVKDLFTSIRNFYLAEMRHLTKSCKKLLKTYQGALDKNRRMRGLASAPKSLAIQARITDADEKLKEIEAAEIPDLKSAWKTVFTSWNQPLEDTAKAIVQMDEILEKIYKYVSDRTKTRWQKAAFGLGLVTLLFGGGLVTSNYSRISSSADKAIGVIIHPPQPPGPTK
jgi:hypothetical protein